MFTSMTHRGLEDDDYEVYSVMFLVGTAVAAFKGCVGKALGFEPPR